MRDNWYHHWVVGAMLDNQLWHQALVMDCVLESLQGSEQGPNDVMMWTLLRRGVINADSVDKPWYEGILWTKINVSWLVSFCNALTGMRWSEAE